MNSIVSAPNGAISEAGFFCGQAPAIQSVNRIVGDVAPTDISVLLAGESGTGKDSYARLIHRLSCGTMVGFQKLSCGTMEPATLFNQFREIVRSERREGGKTRQTIFLDGIHDLDLACQRVLLSLLPDCNPEWGESRLNVRLISSATKCLETEVKAGRFRRELYFRVGGVSIQLPPLRERKSDVEGFLEYFLRKNAKELKRGAPALNPDVEKILLLHDWPGNIRELENVAKNMVALGNPMLALDGLRGSSLGNVNAVQCDTGSSLKLATREAARRTERALILKALERTHWNRKRAANDLKVSYKSLLYKIKRIGLEETDSEPT